MRMKETIYSSTEVLQNRSTHSVLPHSFLFSLDIIERKPKTLVEDSVRNYLGHSHKNYNPAYLEHIEDEISLLLVTLSF